MGFHTDSHLESRVAKRSRVELFTCTRGGGKRCNLIAVGPKSRGIDRATDKDKVGVKSWAAGRE